ncbi:hypothetical protein MUK42_05675 [Musa troglodytarum]|uniref:Uncharacterized protein n=1 Tax=Musa troglodytarum TaxID=320322 RepID=A0A9E7KN74_9LILI|nr:hypothetical protein MUK42_05675 [Musa troglodytarum]
MAQSSLNANATSTPRLRCLRLHACVLVLYVFNEASKEDSTNSKQHGKEELDVFVPVQLWEAEALTSRFNITSETYGCGDEVSTQQARLHQQGCSRTLHALFHEGE